jgi:large subunit ribosomal protein L32e
MITMDIKALEHRQRVKAKKPKFLRQDAHKRAKFRPASWRKPKGYHSKMRLGKKSYAIKVQIGYGSPASVKGLTRNGLAPVLVATATELAALNPKTQGAIIAGTLGEKRRSLLLQAAKEKNVTVLNLKTEEALARIAAAFAASKSARAEKLTEKQKKDVEKKKTVEQRAEEKPAEKEAKAEATEEEEKSKEFAAEKQKVLTKRS